MYTGNSPRCNSRGKERSWQYTLTSVLSPLHIVVCIVARNRITGEMSGTVWLAVSTPIPVTLLPYGRGRLSGSSHISFNYAGKGVQVSYINGEKLSPLNGTTGESPMSKGHRA